MEPSTRTTGVQHVDESRADQTGDGGACEARLEILAGVTQQGQLVLTPVRDERRLDEMWHILVVIDYQRETPRSWNRSLEKDLEVMIRDRFLVHAMARDRHAARHVHEATRPPLTTSCGWRVGLEVRTPEGDR